MAAFDAGTGDKVLTLGTGRTVQFGGYTAGEPSWDTATGVAVAGSVVWVAGYTEAGALDLVPGLSIQSGDMDAFVATGDSSVRRWGPAGF